MAKSLVLNSRSVSVTDNTTAFLGIGGQFLNTGTEANAEFPIREAGSFSNLFVYVPTNNASNSSTITLRKSRVDTALLVTVGGDLTGIFENNADSVSFANTDEAAYEVTVPTEGGTNNLTITAISMTFTPDTAGNCISFLGTCGTVGLTTASSTTYSHLSGSTSAADTNAALSKYRIRGTFTAKNLYLLVSGTNDRTTDTIFRTQKNGANGNQSVTVAGLAEGVFEDTSNTDSLAAGDDYQFQVVTGTGTGTLTYNVLSVTLVSTSDQFVLLSSRQTSNSVGPSLTHYNACKGILLTIASPEINTQVYPGFTFTAKELGVYVTTNTLTGTTTMVLRDNNADSSLTVSYGNVETGLKLDSSNTVEITSGADEINFKITTTAGGTNIGITWMAIMGLIPAVTPSDLNRRRREESRRRAA